MPTYEKAPKEILKRVESVMKRYHGPKHEAGVVVDVLLARPTLDDNGDPRGRAVMVGGYPAYAVIRVLGLRDRAAREFDAEMVIDAENYEVMSSEQQDALIDHELTHLELMVDDKGAIKRDDLDRPRMRCRKHDRHFGWFDEVARRHGESSIEVQQAREMIGGQEFKQLYLFSLEGAVA